MFPPVHEGAAGDGYLPREIAVRFLILGSCAGIFGGEGLIPYPSDTPLPHTMPLPPQEPDQVPFWLWGQGQEGAGRGDGPMRA